VWKFYYTNGALNEEVTWVNDVRNGPWKMYFSDGKLKLDGNIVNDVWQGMFKYYFVGGNIYYTGMFKDNVKDGIWMEFNEDGQGVKKETYQNGILLKTEDLLPKKDTTQPQKQ
jgi:antitoxin component YwqK of YwqJK toxin-antitoxin module